MRRHSLQLASGMGWADGIADAGLGLAMGMGRLCRWLPARPAAGPLQVSTGVSEGMLMAPIRPVYPPIARAAQWRGAVVVEAMISRDGDD